MARDREYEKEARAYKHFIVKEGKAIGGWEFASDARDELRAMKEESRLGDAKIVARSRLAQLGIDPKRPFATPLKGPASGFGKEKTVADFKARIAWEKRAEATQRRMGHETLAEGHALARVAYEKELERLKAEGGRSPSAMRLVYLPVNMAWIFALGVGTKSEQVIVLSGEPRFHQSREEAVAAARRHGLAVSKSGIVSVSGPNPFAGEGSGLARVMKHESGGNPHTGASGKKYPRVQLLKGSGAGWFKPGQYGIVVGENRTGGMHLQDGPGRVSRPGEVAYAVGKSERSGAVWFSGAALRFTGKKSDVALKARVKALVGGKK